MVAKQTRREHSPLGLEVLLSVSLFESDRLLTKTQPLCVILDIMIMIIFDDTLYTSILFKLYSDITHFLSLKVKSIKIILMGLNIESRSLRIFCRRLCSYNCYVTVGVN